MLNPEHNEGADATQPEVIESRPADARRHDLQDIADLTNQQTARQTEQDQAEADRQLDKFRDDFFAESGISGHALADGRWFVENAAGQYMTFSSQADAYRAQSEAEGRNAATANDSGLFDKPGEMPGQDPNPTGEMQEDILVADMTPAASSVEDEPNQSSEVAELILHGQKPDALEPKSEGPVEWKQINSQLDQRFRVTDGLIRALHREADDKLLPLERSLQGSPMAAQLMQARREFQEQLEGSSRKLTHDRASLRAQPDFDVAQAFSEDLHGEAERVVAALDSLVRHLNQLSYRTPQGPTGETLQSFGQQSGRLKRELASLAAAESLADRVGTEQIDASEDSPPPIEVTAETAQ